MDVFKKDIMFIIINRDKTKHDSVTREARLSSDGSTRADEAATQKTSSPPYGCLRLPILSPDTRARMQMCVWKEPILPEPRASQVVQQSHWERCHQFVPSRGGHAGDEEAMAALCPHRA